MRRFIRSVLFGAFVLAAISVEASETRPDNPTPLQAGWSDWDRFVERFVQADGRVIDVTFEGKTTSEGQSYGLFFALVANRRDQFDTLLKWTSDNLADGELDKNLPGWLWGKRDDGSWGIKDKNAASDADLWIAYSLLEAGRLWGEPRYDALGKKILAMIAKRDVVRAGSAGTLLLPGPIGFELSNKRYRINPSYLPEFMFRYFAKVDPSGPWADVWTSYERMSPKIFSQGIAPDAVVIDTKGNVMPDTEREPSGSYDAIRVYLWAGMTPQSDKQTLPRIATYAKLIDESGSPPEKVDPRTGKVVKADYSPLGFSGAALPYLAALNDKRSLEAQWSRIKLAAAEAKLGKTTHYYDQVLILFGKGFMDGYYRFDVDGKLMPKWK